MHELAISPQGRLVVRETTEESSSHSVSKQLVAAYAESPAEGMFHSASDAAAEALPASFEFPRSIARQYLAEFCKAAGQAVGAAIPETPNPPQTELEAAVLRAPPVVGLEYLNAEVLAEWWRELDAYVREQARRTTGGVQAFLREHDVRWRFVGRVTFHLAENKRDEARPFAFLATYANGLTPQGKVKHEPLGAALKQYAGARNREAMLNLLLPVSKAAESCDLVRRLVDSGELYQPLAWTPRQAYEFLRAIPLFESSGLIVRTPDWWHARTPARPKVGVRIDAKNAATLTLNSMLQFSVDVALDGESLSKEEIDRLLESSGGLVPLRGKWVEVDAEKLKEALTHWKKVERDVRDTGISFFDGMRLLSGANLSENEAKEREATVREWTGLSAGPALEKVLAGLRTPESLTEKAPPGLKADLRPYQRVGYSWLRFAARLGLGACLADDMGLGKTIQVLSLLLDLKRDKQKSPSLLVVPASLIANWKAEAARFAPELRLAVVHPSESAKIEEKDVEAFDVVVTTYGMLVRTEWLKQRRWRLAILDEAQAIKNSAARQTRAVKELAADGRVAMTGTPIENRLSDLWSLFDFLNPGLFGKAKEFGAFVRRLQDGEAPSFEPMRNLVRPYILRRLKTDRQVISDLPEKTEVNAWCTLSKKQAALYRHAVDDLRKRLETSSGIARRGLVLAQLMRLKQICNHPAQATGTNDFAPDESGKFRRLGEIAEEIASRQQKVLVFTQFREMTDPLSDYLATFFGRPGIVLHGGTSVKRRKELVEEFQRDDGPPFFVLSLKAGGVGLNLTAASHVVHFDRWWNPAVENQATDRAFRIGQKRNVLVHRFVCQGTVEERIDDMIARKSQVAAEVFGGEASGEALLTEMDDDTLMKFVSIDIRRASDG